MGFWSGVKSGFVGAAKGTWEGIKGAGNYAYDFATDGATREAAWDSTVSASKAVGNYAADSWNDPAKPFRDVGDAASNAYSAADNFVRTADAEQWGELAGGGAFTAATLPVGGLAGKAVSRGGAALKASRASSALDKARKSGKLEDGKPKACKDCAAAKKKKRKPHVRDDIPDDFIDDDGNPIYPTAADGYPDGFDGPIETVPLEKGTLIDRYNHRPPDADNGSFFSPPGTPFEQRALPIYEADQYHTIYRVKEPFEVQSGKAAPWFGEAGGGIQYKSELSPSQMLDRGILEIVEVRPPQ